MFGGWAGIVAGLVAFFNGKHALSSQTEGCVVFRHIESADQTTVIEQVELQHVPPSPAQCDTIDALSVSNPRHVFPDRQFYGQFSGSRSDWMGSYLSVYCETGLCCVFTPERFRNLRQQGVRQLPVANACHSEAGPAWQLREGGRM